MAGSPLIPKPYDSFRQGWGGNPREVDGQRGGVGSDCTLYYTLQNDKLSLAYQVKYFDVVIQNGDGTSNYFLSKLRRIDFQMYTRLHNRKISSCYS